MKSLFSSFYPIDIRVLLFQPVTNVLFYLAGQRLVPSVSSTLSACLTVIGLRDILDRSCDRFISEIAKDTRQLQRSHVHRYNHVLRHSGVAGLDHQRFTGVREESRRLFGFRTQHNLSDRFSNHVHAEK